jgi:hypothetical protein
MMSFGERGRVIVETYPLDKMHSPTPCWCTQCRIEGGPHNGAMVVGFALVPWDRNRIRRWLEERGLAADLEEDALRSRGPASLPN